MIVGWTPLGVCPFEDLQVADIGDVNLNIYNLPEAVRHIKAAFSKIIANGCIPLTMGGDHTITYPILQAMKGFRVVTARECWYKSLEPLMAEVKSMMGDRPVYLSFDIDGLDPSFAPGTGVKKS
nr:hypothetical protein BaRGS_003932 [Batillaria attramentaria]